MRRAAVLALLISVLSPTQTSFGQSDCQATGYLIPTGGSGNQCRINQHGASRVCYNNGAQTIFAPTATASEWSTGGSAFLNSPPADVVCSLSAPTDLVVSLITVNSARLSWSAVAGAISYETSTNGSTWTDRGNVLLYNFTGFSSNAAISLYVRAKVGGTPGLSAMAPSLTLPTNPTSLVVGSITGNSIGLTWTVPDGAPSAQVSLNGISWTGAATLTSHTFTGLSSATAYTLYVRTTNASGAGAYSTANASTTGASCTVNWNPNPECDSLGWTSNRYATNGNVVANGATVPVSSSFIDCSDHISSPPASCFRTCNNGTWQGSLVSPMCLL